jgi:hypothetical protein
LGGNIARTRFVQTIIAACLAALVSLPCVAVLDGLFPVENLSVEMTNRIRNNREDPIAWAKERSNRWTSLYRTTVACLSVFGASVGVAFSVLGSSGANSILQSLRNCVSGGLVCFTAAALGAFLESALLMKLESSGIDLTIKTMIGHAVAWSFLGAGVGIVSTSGSCLRAMRYGAVGRGLAGGVFAAIVYAPLTAVIFQLERSDISIPEGGLNKLFFLSSAAILIGICVRYSQPSLARAAQSQPDNASLESAGHSIVAPTV